MNATIDWYFRDAGLVPESDAERRIEIRARAVHGERKLPVVERFDQTEYIPLEELDVHATGPMQAGVPSLGGGELEIGAGTQPQPPRHHLGLEPQTRRDQGAIEPFGAIEGHVTAALDQR